MLSHDSNLLQQESSAHHDVKRRACDICKRRKVRCNSENPCSNCVRHNVCCQYSTSHGRLAQTERRLKLVQDRLRKLETAWKQHLPGVELPGTENERTVGIPVLETKTDTAVTEVVLPPKDTSSEEHISPPDSEYEDVDTLDWDESLDIAAVTDGMGSLSMKWKGIGYMGPQTGNTLLRKLQSISVLYMDPDDDLSLEQSPQPEISSDVLQSPQFTNQCINWYFKFYHCAYPILHEGCFRAQLMGVLPKPKDGSWPILLNTILAIGAFSGDLCYQNADIHFYREASKYLSWDILRRGTLSLVQAFALLANYLQKRNKPNSCFTLLGIAMNMAQGIGLHREFVGPAVSTFTMEIRRRVWWTMFILDSGFRLTFGRPTLSHGGMNTRLPRNLNDNDLVVDLDELPPSQEVPTVTSCVIWQTRLAKIGNRANERLVAKHVPDQSSMLALGEEVVQWVASLPHYMRAEYDNPDFEMYVAPRMILLWRSMHLRIIIHRPYLLQLIRDRNILDFNDLNNPGSRCFSAADECVVSILTFFNKSTSRHGALIWYACYWLLTAVFVHVTCLLYQPQHASALLWRQRIEESTTTLKWMGSHLLTAARAAQILDKIMGLVPTSPDSTLFALNEPIRMEVAELWNQSWANVVVPQEPSPPQWLSDIPFAQ